MNLQEKEKLTEIIDNLRSYRRCVEENECLYLVVVSKNEKKVYMLTHLNKVISKPLYIKNSLDIDPNEFDISPFLIDIIILLTNMVTNSNTPQQQGQ